MAEKEDRNGVLEQGDIFFFYPPPEGGLRLAKSRQPVRPLVEGDWA
jgi:hypothetical protein